MTTKLGFELDAEEEVEVEEFGPIPEGEYELKVADAEVVDAKSGAGQNLKVELSVIGPERVGAKIWEYFCIKHQKPEVEKRAKGRLIQLYKACGFNGVSDDAADIIGEVFTAVVAIQEGTGGYKDSNRIHEYLEPNGKSATAFDKTPSGGVTLDDDDIPF